MNVDFYWFLISTLFFSKSQPPQTKDVKEYRAHVPQQQKWEKVMQEDKHLCMKFHELVS